MPGSHPGQCRTEKDRVDEERRPREKAGQTSNPVLSCWVNWNQTSGASLSAANKVEVTRIKYMVLPELQGCGWSESHLAGMCLEFIPSTAAIAVYKEPFLLTLFLEVPSA